LNINKHENHANPLENGPQFVLSGGTKRWLIRHDPYPQLCHKIKMAKIVGVVCTGSYWKGQHVPMMKTRENCEL